MNRDNLIRALREALTPGSQNHATAIEAASRLPPDFADAIFIHTIAKPIEMVLAKDEPFGDGSGFLIQRDNGYSGFHANEAAIALARRVLRGETSERAVTWLERVLATEEGTGLGVLALWGVEVASPIELTHGVRLLPFSALPDSSTKTWLSRPRDPTALPGFLGSMFVSPPKAALVCSYTVRPFLHPTKLGEPPPQVDPLRIQSLLDDARLALTLVGPSWPVSAGYWFQFDDPDLVEASFYGGVMTSYQEVLPWGTAPDVALDGSDAQRVGSAFLNLSDPLRATLRLALKRLNQAIRRPPHGDRALDLSIALESLLVDGAGENTYKIALRAALILPVPLEQRLKVRATIGALYALRSALVHDGVLPSEVKVGNVGKRSASEVVKEATEICATVLRTVLEGGSIPNWYECELTGGRHTS